MGVRGMVRGVPGMYAGWSLDLRGVRGMVRGVRGMYTGWSVGCTRDGPWDVRGVRGVCGFIFIPRTFPRTPRTVRGIYASCPRSFKYS